MRIAIVGGGVTGLTAAYEFTKKGHAVTVFERDDHLGGLAYGFKAKNWDWYLEAAYHHLFTNDHAIINLCHELGVPLIYRRPVTANLYNGKAYQLDSAPSLLRFPLLPLSSKLRTGMLAAFCKAYPFWRTLEGITAKQFAIALGGMEGWKRIWEPLMTAKFGTFADTIAASWLWARIHKRTPSLAYIEGGFQTLVNALAEAIRNNGGTILTLTSVESIKKSTNDKSANLQINYKKWNDHLSFDICHLTFERILLTAPTPIVTKLMPQLKNSLSEALEIPHLHAQVLILETKEPILKDTYWLSITDKTFPFLAVVAHTNFMDKKHYGGNHLVYIGNYLPDGHPYLSLTKEQLLKKFLPFIRRLSTFDFRLLDSFLFVGPYAQPVHQLHYSRVAPKLETGIPGVYLANMDSIYPWDRGTNYAVELGMRAARAMEQ